MAQLPKDTRAEMRRYLFLGEASSMVTAPWETAESLQSLFGMYEVQDSYVAGQGAQGRVHALRPQDTLDGQAPQQLWVIKAASADDPAAEQLKQEWSIYVHLGPSPKITRVVAFVQQSGIVGIVMEAGKMSLQDAITSDAVTLSDQQIVEIARDSAVGVLAMHSMGQYHNDLKPANIILFEDENDLVIEGKIADLGLASANRPRPSSGTLSVFPPEDLRRRQRINVLIEAGVDPRTASKATTQYELQERKVSGPGNNEKKDVWGIGIILFMGIFGKTPYSYVELPDDLEPELVRAADVEQGEPYWLWPARQRLRSPLGLAILQVLLETLCRVEYRISMVDLVDTLQDLCRLPSIAERPQPRPTSTALIPSSSSLDTAPHSPSSADADPPELTAAVDCTSSFAVPSPSRSARSLIDTSLPHSNAGFQSNSTGVIPGGSGEPSDSSTTSSPRVGLSGLESKGGGEGIEDKSPSRLLWSEAGSGDSRHGAKDSGLRPLVVEQQRDSSSRRFVGGNSRTTPSRAASIPSTALRTTTNTRLARILALPSTSSANAAEPDSIPALPSASPAFSSVIRKATASARYLRSSSRPAPALLHLPPPTPSTSHAPHLLRASVTSATASHTVSAPSRRPILIPHASPSPHLGSSSRSTRLAESTVGAEVGQRSTPEVEEGGEGLEKLVEGSSAGEVGTGRSLGDDAVEGHGGVVSGVDGDQDGPIQDAQALPSPPLPLPYLWPNEVTSFSGPPRGVEYLESTRGPLKYGRPNKKDALFCCSICETGVPLPAVDLEEHYRTEHPEVTDGHHQRGPKKPTRR